MSKTKKTVYYILLILVSALFIFSGVSKLTANAQAVQGFQVASLPLWLMYVVGAAEVLGAIGLWIGKTRTWASIGLFIILLGAIVVTAIFVGVSMTILPIATAIALYFVVRLGKEKDSQPAVPAQA